MTDDPPPPPRIETLADCFLYLDSPQLRAELEEARVAWEASHGPADLTTFYTCYLPQHVRDWLTAHEPGRYFQGLPPFVQEFVYHKCQQYETQGVLDVVPRHLRDIYRSGDMARHLHTRAR